MSIRRSLRWMGLGQGCVFALQFGSSVVLARLLSPHETGVFALGASILGLLAVVQGFGLNNLVVAEPTLTPRLMDSIVSVNLAVALTLAAAVAALGALGGALLGDPEVGRVLGWLALIPVIGALEFRPLANLERAGDFKAVAFGRVLRTAATAVATLPLAFAGYSSVGLAVGQVAGAAAGMLALNVLGRRFLGWRLSFGEWRRIARYAVQVLSVSGVNVAAQRTSEILLGQLLGLGALGLYARAVSVHAILWDNVLAVVARIALVDLAAARREGRALGPRYLRMVEMATALLWPAFGGMAVVAGPLIRTVYGPAWLPAAAPLALLAVAGMVLISVIMTWELFLACGEVRRQGRIEYRRSAVGLLLFAGGCLVSLPMAAAARIAEAGFSALLYRPHINRMTGTVTADYRPLFRRSAGLAAAALAPAAAAMAAHGWSPETPLAVLVPAILLGVLFWLGLLARLRHPLLAEARRMLRRG